MPSYLIRHTKAGHGDTLIEDVGLVLTLTPQWARFSDSQGVVLALPIEQVTSIERVDEPQDQEPAPQKE